MKNRTLSHLSDAALVTEVKRLACTEHDVTVALVIHLAELGARRLYLAAGFSSLFGYCREVLALTEGEAYNRVTAARAVRKFPFVLDRLTNGFINLTTIRLLFKHLTPTNHRELLEASTGKSKRDVERLLAARFPQPAVSFSARKVPSAPGIVEPSLPFAALVETGPAQGTSSDAVGVVVPIAPPVAEAGVARPVRPATITPTAEDQFSVRFTATSATWEKLQAAQDLLRHSVPKGEVSVILDRALKLLLEDLARKKSALRRGRERARARSRARVTSRTRSSAPSGCVIARGARSSASPVAVAPSVVSSSFTTYFPLPRVERPRWAISNFAAALTMSTSPRCSSERSGTELIASAKPSRDGI